LSAAQEQHDARSARMRRLIVPSNVSLVRSLRAAWDRDDFSATD
jgi:hypothetical protein